MDPHYEGRGHDLLWVTEVELEMVAVPGLGGLCAGLSVRGTVPETKVPYRAYYLEAVLYLVVR